MNTTDISLKNPKIAYLFGFLQADGHYYKSTRNRGKIVIEVSKKDEALLWAFKELVPCHSSITERVRSTNFADDYNSVTWAVYDKRFRDLFESWGLLSGRKSSLIDVPCCQFSEVDYFRGLLDGDGALGLTTKGFPFLSFVTAGSSIADQYLKFLNRMTGKTKTSSRNVRDQVYNIAVYKEDAQLITQGLYYQDCLALPRKRAKAEDVLTWKRPLNMKRITTRKSWTPEQDQFVLNHSIETSIAVLNRSQSSIKLRLWRLKQLNERS
ncbi:LAGLIDADG family homing endonuclease [Phormidesmis sp. 146-35]